MKNISEFKNQGIQFVLTDIDDTLTRNGRLEPSAFQALWSLHESGLDVIPVTGRPAGWCEMIARSWPVGGVIGENGGFYFRYHGRQMKRHFYFDSAAQEQNRQRLSLIRDEVLKAIPGSAVASDQFCRLMDLAIDFCEDVAPLSDNEIQQIVEVFKKHGAQAKVSSIHVNGWFGDYNKLRMTELFFQREHNWKIEDHLDKIVFVGDSPNDEPMFDFFPNSVGVANVKDFENQLRHPPKFVTKSPRGQGFAELVKQLLN